ncbi:oxidoreductase-like domain-containing protein [Chitinimonas sp. BJB300]|uniref:oxidoreductase-like domain-containing protein n=1 Tax=Chitinimonas sp. BJB300 TaxID=1559339 RepID=UPI000C0E54E9|nr:oxidoreductase-like domain-containing protein [Chitinimonas sp. BJB300]PHV12626.1 oxidoreductase [Chitinimonas sp. BJB300]TSJ90195.1 oxidoreductase [Chitinimonas sp. BJB300]
MQNKLSDEDPRPVEPIAPSPGECCNSGCDPCIFDFYSEELQEYRLRLAEWELRQASKE